MGAVERSQESESSQACEASGDSGLASSGWVLVVAVARNGVIGRGGDLPWRLSSDLKRFKSLTMGHCLLMGRKTFESIGRCLPGRQTIVLSRRSWQFTGEPITVAHAPQEVDSLVENERRVMVVGGGEVYRACLPLCSELWLTRVQAEVEGDTFMPAIDWDTWKQSSTESVAAGPKDQYPTQFEVWVRK